jgi:hypothetical protein
MPAPSACSSSPAIDARIRTGGSEPPVQPRCGICDRPIEAAPTGSDFHPACFARRLPEDAFVALIAATVLLLAPAIVVWAG